MTTNHLSIRRRKSLGPIPACVMCMILALNFFLPKLVADDAPKTDATSDVAAQFQSYLSKGNLALAEGNLDQAIRCASLALQLDSKSAAPYELRGSIYIQKKLWDRAERDYTTANKISPNSIYDYKKAEIKYLQRAYDDARPRFAKLTADPQIGDLATFKVFLCDLFALHDASATKDLSAMKEGDDHPSYLYSRAAWCWVHGPAAQVNQFLTTARDRYGSSTYDLYTSSLTEIQRFHPAVATFVTKDGTEYNQSRVFLENDGLRATTAQGWTTIPLDQLPDDLSAFSADLRDQLEQKRAQAVVAQPSNSTVSFVTKSCKTYHQVRSSLQDDGLSVLSVNGWITIPFQDLPDDLSTFSTPLQEGIKEKRDALAKTQSGSRLVSFQTTQGKDYENVEALLTEHGIRVLTSDGWITVVFSALPDDVSSFPLEWREKILLAHGEAQGNASGMEVVSFTTTKGRHYDQVRAAIGQNGLRLVTDQGMVAVAFNLLPDDLSAFPEEWRQKIALRQAEMRKQAVTK